MLEWKLSRDKKRQIDRKKHKNDLFVVKHVNHSPPPYLIADKQGTEAMPVASANRRPMTRQYAKQQQISRSNIKDNANNKSRRGIIERQGKETRNFKKQQNARKEDIQACEDKRAATTDEASNYPSCNGFSFKLDREKKVPTKFSFQNPTCSKSDIKHSNSDKHNPASHEHYDSNQTLSNKYLIASTQNHSGTNEDKDNFANGVVIDDVQCTPSKNHVTVEETSGKETAKGHRNIEQGLTIDGDVDAASSNDKTEGCITALNPIESEMETSEPSQKSTTATPRSLRDTPARRAAKTSQLTPRKCEAIVSEVIDSANRVSPVCPFNATVIGQPGKTPKRLTNIPRHLNDTISNGGFTPRRFQSSAHFYKLVCDTEKKLVELNNSWNCVLDGDDLTDEVSGRIRTVIGQSQLLISQRFKQFQDLVKIHQSKSADKDATASDLQGFWDMIFYQVEDVYKKFEELKKMKENNWNDQRTNIIRKTNKIVKKKVKNTSNSTLSARQEEMRKFKLAMKAKMNAEKTSHDTDAKTTMDKKAQEAADDVFVTNDTTKNVVQEDELAFSKYLRPSTSDMKIEEEDLLGLGIRAVENDSLEQIENNMASLIMDSTIDHDHHFDSPLIKF